MALRLANGPALWYNREVGKESEFKTIAVNRKARHAFEFLERFEAGIELRGTEVKSLREGLVSLQESYARIRGSELFLIGANIAQYKAGSYLNHEPTRPRKLLLHRREIDRLARTTAEKRLTIVPVRMYFKRGMVKVEIAVARGRMKYEKREALKEREDRKRIDREMSRRR